MLRLYNPNSGEHLYTLSQNEYNTLSSIGWVPEGPAWTAPEASSTVVYRLYNPHTGDHHYTMSTNEYETLGRIGWVKEGIAWYGVADDATADPFHGFTTRTPIMGSATATAAEMVAYYERSGGGVTVSGGDPLVQSDFVAALFVACRAEGIHTCCESTLCFAWPVVERLLPVTDLWISDLKMMDSARHRHYTGEGNALILRNLQALAGLGQELILRIPIIPGVNDDRANIEASAAFIRGQLGGRVRCLQLLSFMRLGTEKYKSLGMSYQMSDVRMNRRAFQRKVGLIAAYFNSQGIHCLVGTHEKD